MNDQPREEKPPAGADQPTAVQPTAQGKPAAQGEPAAGQGEPATQAVPSPPAGPAAASQPAGTAPGEGGAAAQPPADQTAVHGQQPPPAPPTPQLSQPGPGQTYAWGPPAARQPGGFRRFVGHRATQLVGVGVLGLLVGGGIVGGIAAATHHGPRDGRPGIHRQYDGPNGNQGFNGRGHARPGSGDGI
ncbi:hypothetical protein [Amycolatopsis vancoresmycina]|uniref:Uncharacterized protein n=1 Tax=Amycolatopsis vancoresmycina DSM 44592 TaxID=1292037 RepID=R1HUD3_9PSEU|nr:hypothetical protein [Amycolatopsis vancoresmycina]EOD67160.1 hypothetical protein H480_17897 [Amycolatopsis vancoresmycina DSM 44592]